MVSGPCVRGPDALPPASGERRIRRPARAQAPGLRQGRIGLAGKMARAALLRRIARARVRAEGVACGAVLLPSTLSLSSSAVSLRAAPASARDAAVRPNGSPEKGAACGGLPARSVPRSAPPPRCRWNRRPPAPWMRGLDLGQFHHLVQRARLVARQRRVERRHHQRGQARQQGRIVHRLALREQRQQVVEVIAGQHARQRLEREMQPPAELGAGKARQRARERFEEAVEDGRVVAEQIVLHERRRIGIHAAHQPQEGGAAGVGGARHLQRGHEQRAQHMLAAQPLRPALLARGQQRQPARVERVEPAAEHRLHQRFLAAEVIVDGGQVDLGARRDLPQRHRLVAELDEQQFGGFQNAVLGVSCARTGHVSCLVVLGADHAFHCCGAALERTIQTYVLGGPGMLGTDVLKRQGRNSRGALEGLGFVR